MSGDGSIKTDKGILFYNATFEAIANRGEIEANGFEYKGAINQTEKEAMLEALESRPNVEIELFMGNYYIAWDESGYEFDLTIYPDSAWFICQRKSAETAQ